MKDTKTTISGIATVISGLVAFYTAIPQSELTALPQLVPAQYQQPVALIFAVLAAISHVYGQTQAGDAGSSAANAAAIKSVAAQTGSTLPAPPTAPAVKLVAVTEPPPTPGTG
jgi:hypothetical protein